MESSFLRRSLLPRCCFSDASKVFDGMPQAPLTTCVEKKKKKKNAVAALLARAKRLVRWSTDANAHKEDPVVGSMHTDKIGNDESTIPHLDTKEALAGPFLSLVTADRDGDKIGSDESAIPHLDTKEVPAGPFLSLVTADSEGDLPPPPPPAAGPWICGHQACLELVMRLAADRHAELQRLTLRRAVSGFPHRNRIHPLLPGRFLRNEDLPEEERRQPLVAARELGQLRQRHPDSGLRLENIVRGQAASRLDSSSTQNAEPSTIDHSESSLSASEDTQDTHLHANDNLTKAHNWHHDHSEQHVDQESVLIRGANTFTLGDDDNVYSTELRELLIRRRVSNLLHSAFRENLDRLIRSYVEWQGRGPLSLYLEGTPAAAATPDPQEQGQEQNRDDDEEQELLRDHFPEVNEVWHDDDESNERAHNWHDDNLDKPVDQESVLIRKVKRTMTFTPSDDDNVYSTELRELLSRRSVSNLLDSSFRGILDRLIRSYVERQGRGPLSLNLEGTPAAAATPDSPEQGEEQHRDDDEEQELRDANVRPCLVIPPRQPVLLAEAMHEYLFIYC